MKNQEALRPFKKVYFVLLSMPVLLALTRKITFSEATSGAFSLQKKMPVAEENGYFSLYSGKNNAFNSIASLGFILPPNIRRSCLLLNAPANNSSSSAVSGTNSGTGIVLPL